MERVPYLPQSLTIEDTQTKERMRTEYYLWRKALICQALFLTIIDCFILFITLFCKFLIFETEDLPGKEATIYGGFREA